MKKAIAAILIALSFGLSQAACSGKFWGGAAAGVAGTGAAYELKNKQQMDRLEDDYKGGKMSQKEYETRKDQIRKGSVIY